MDIGELRDYCLSLEDVSEKTPFGKFSPRFDSVLVFYVLDHMFCISDIENFTAVNVCITPEQSAELRQHFTSVSTPINRGLKNWISIEVGGDMPDTLIYDLVKRSHDIVMKKHWPGRRKSTDV